MKKRKNLTFYIKYIYLICLIFKDQQMIITINTITGIIQIIEKEEKIKTAPKFDPPIQYHEKSIKRKYYKKWDPEYHRNKIWLWKIRQDLNIITKRASRILTPHKTVIQAQLLDLDF